MKTFLRILRAGFSREAKSAFLWAFMGKIYCVCALAIVGLILFALATQKGEKPATPQGSPQRIVSLAPAITETLYALNLGDNVAGVTEFCAWPPEAAQKPKTGGFREVNLEAIARSGADLAILPADMDHFKDSIEAMGIPVMLFDYSSLASFLGAVKELGALCGRESEAAALTAEFAKATRKLEKEKIPRVLFALLNPDEYNRPIREMTVIGAEGFYSGLIEAAGGRNAYTGKTPFPRMSLESVIAMNPDVIVVGAPELADREQLERRWREIGQLDGVKGERLLVLTDPGDTIPGPRSLSTLKKIAHAIEAADGADHEGSENARIP